MQHEHCWHDTGVLLLSHPPKVVDRCCHCNETRHKDQTLFMDGKIHGPYLRGWHWPETSTKIPVVDMAEAT